VPEPAGPDAVAEGRHARHDVQGGVGEPDAFQRLWTPHRMAYIERGATGTGPEDCPFCRIPRGPDAEGLVVARGSQVYAVLNLFPYNPGHLMVVPYRHVAGYEELTAEESAELAATTVDALQALREVSAPQGFNLGMNLGVVAGAGIAGHLHQHVVPRWGGDTNFMPVVGHTKVLPQLLAETRERVAASWPAGGGRRLPGSVRPS
jgi:ATP adenylyltransferase